MRAPISQPGALPGNAQDCAIGAFIFKNFWYFGTFERIENNLDLGWGLI
jgi:hypothetical protein